jgi:hypothetical protein
MKSLGSTARLAIVCALGGVALFGCHHSSSSDDPYTPDRVAAIRQQLKYHHVAVHPFTATPKVDDPATALTDCHDSAVAFLKAKSVFASVDNAAADDAPDTLVADVEVEDMRIVGGAARFWAGAMAGSSFMHVKLTLRDASSHAVVFERPIETDNNAFAASWSWGASDRNLPGNVGVAIADLVIQVAQGQTPPVQVAQ